MDQAQVEEAEVGRVNDGKVVDIVPKNIAEALPAAFAIHDDRRTAEPTAAPDACAAVNPDRAGAALTRATMEGSDEPYPGALATPAQLLRLAREYRSAATLLLVACRRGEPLSQAPFRLAAVHAIELYLNALLLHHGHQPSFVRGLQHDLGRRTALAVATGLKLRVRTASHLDALSAERELLQARYGAERLRPPPPNRLAATLEEVAGKVSDQIARHRMECRATGMRSGSCAVKDAG